jgi:hypothetical protein
MTAHPASLRRALLACASFAAIGCGTVTVRVPVMRPAEVNMAPYSSVGVGEVKFSGNTGGGNAVGGLLEQELVAVTAEKIPELDTDADAAGPERTTGGGS